MKSALQQALQNIRTGMNFSNIKAQAGEVLPLIKATPGWIGNSIANTLDAWGASAKERASLFPGFLERKFGGQPGFSTKPLHPGEARAANKPQATAVPTAMPTTIPTATPTLTPTTGWTKRVPSPTPAAQYAHAIVVPDERGKNYEIPQTIVRGGKKFDLPQALMENFDDIKEATNAARVLRHPMESTAIAGEKARGVNTGPNRGENPNFYFGHDVQNEDGTWDRGLFRINSSTFNEMKNKPYWAQRMAQVGINSWEDMNDPLLNLRMARLRLEYGNWSGGKIKENPTYRYWYAAPQELRQR